MVKMFDGSTESALESLEYTKAHDACNRMSHRHEEDRQRSRMQHCGAMLSDKNLTR